MQYVGRHSLEKIADEFSLMDIIEALSDYSIIHSDLFTTNTKERLLGGVSHESRKIYINTNQDNSERRGTLIHELVHVHSYQRGFELKEGEVKEVAERIEKRLLGWL